MHCNKITRQSTLKCAAQTVKIRLFGLGRKFWVLKATVCFHSSSRSFILKDKGKLDSLWYESIKGTTEKKTKKKTAITSEKNKMIKMYDMTPLRRKVWMCADRCHKPLNPSPIISCLHPCVMLPALIKHHNLLINTAWPIMCHNLWAERQVSPSEVLN